MSTAGPAEPIPLTVLTGFLGAGKTSLLNRLIHDPALAETAVIINEFGEVGLDHLLVRPIRDGVVLLQSGCLCCTLRGDLVDALEQLLRDLDNGRAMFRRVTLETTGLADPAPVLQTAMAHPYLVLRYRLDGVITVVDAVNGAATLDAHMESVKQVAVADRIVLSKTDLLAAPENGRALVARLRALNPARPSSTPRPARPRPSACSAAGCSIPTARSPTSRAGSRPRPLRPPVTTESTITITTMSIVTTSAFARSRLRARPRFRPPCSTCSSISCARCTDPVSFVSRAS
jgi:Ni2+-binding GTPase involved in maturation of urease and hydrogenase